MTPQQKFWRRVIQGDVEECWPWKGSCRSGGYGSYHWGGRLLGTHRIAWMLTKGNGVFPAPDEHVHHLCRNRSCCNPRHLDLVPSHEHSVMHGYESRGRVSSLTLVSDSGLTV